MRILGRSFLVSVPFLAAMSFSQVIGGNWNHSWTDDFNSGQSDLGGFTYELGNNGGWGNNELERYTNSQDNVHVDGGNLNITALYDGHEYTSGRITTANLFSQTGGLFEFRAKMPTGQGLWPALWMFPKDSAYGGWPTSGEIDAVETVGQSSTLVQGTLHSGPIWYQDDVQTQTFANSGMMPGGFSTHDWHTYDLEWQRGVGGQAGYFRWFVDGILYETQHGGWYTPAGGGPDAPFDQPFFLILNVAVGGNYVGNPNLQVNTPYSMQVDYIHTYTAAPEPASLAVLALGGLFLRGRKRRK